MQQPGLELQAMFKAVAQSVYDATKNAPEPQIPVQTYKLTPTFYFRAAAVQPVAGPTAPAAFDPRAAELAMWQSAQSLGTVEAFRDYLSQYPHGQFSTQATLRIDALSRPTGGGATLDAAAMNTRGLDYLNGTNGFAQSDTEAVRWFKMAAEQGDPAGEADLGFMYDAGRGGLAQDYAEAVRWYKKAAEQGNASGEGNLGFMYGHGRGVTQSDTEAVRWYKKAAEQGNASGEGNLGFMYEHGRGVAQSDTEAVRWYKKAAEQGDAQGKANLGAMYDQGRGGLSQDYAEAVRWFKQAAEQGNVTGEYNLAVMYRNGRGVAQNDAEALKWYAKAARNGDEDAQAYLRSRGVSW
jgi:TPR repeat protein